MKCKKIFFNSTKVVAVTVKALNSPTQALMKCECCAVRKTVCHSEESVTLLGT